MVIHKVYSILGNSFRQARMTLLKEKLHINEGTTIVDLGGTPEFWSNIGVDVHVTCVNKDPGMASHSCPGNVRMVIADALSTGFADKSFDVAFSNSCLEHVGSRENQKRFALELERVGKSVWVQTPAYEFPIEPHFLMPFFHWLPRNAKLALVGFTPWGVLVRPSRKLAEGMVDEIQLVKRKEMEDLFPTCTIVAERFLWFHKAWIAIRVEAPQ